MPWQLAIKWLLSCGKLLLDPRVWFMLVIAAGVAHFKATWDQKKICRAAGKASIVALESERMKRDAEVRRVLEAANVKIDVELRAQRDEHDKQLAQFDNVEKKGDKDVSKVCDGSSPLSDAEWEWLRRIR